MQWVGGSSSRRLQQEFAELSRLSGVTALVDAGYFCAASGTVADEMVKAYLESHQGRGPDPDFKIEEPSRQPASAGTLQLSAPDHAADFSRQQLIFAFLLPTLA
jgi:hypothetical protein